MILLQAHKLTYMRHFATISKFAVVDDETKLNPHTIIHRYPI